MSLRIGILGGMFDPVHEGHIEAALCAKTNLNLDHVRMVPCGTPGHRRQALGSPQQRLQMLRLATAPYPGLVVDDREFRNSDVSYTYQTLVSVADEFPGATLCFILGLDAFNQLDSWFRWRELFSLCHFVVVSRPGYKFSGSETLEKEVHSRVASNVQTLFRHLHGQVFFIDDLAVDVSSSQVREKIVKGGSLGNLVPPAVIEYLTANALYRCQKVRELEGK